MVHLGHLASMPQEGESLVGVVATGMGFECRRRTGGGRGGGLDRDVIGGILYLAGYFGTVLRFILFRSVAYLVLGSC